MTMPEAVFHRPAFGAAAAPGRRTPAVGGARLLATRSPRQYPHGAGLAAPWSPAGHLRPGQGGPGRRGRGEPACAAREGCLARSLATVLLCRLRRPVADLVRRARGGCRPSRAHAWVEADGAMVGEDYPPDYFRTLFRVP